MKKTDVLRVEEFLRSTKGFEFNHRRIVDDMHITEYSGRFSDVRKKWGCTCGKNKLTCTAIEHVQNTRKGWYRYVNKKLYYKTEFKPVKSQITQIPEHAETLQGQALSKWEETRRKLGL